MKVFISWSGQTSHAVAAILRDWLPSVIQSVQPYVSSEDIDKGARWSTDIAGELDQSAFGILCVTKDNVNAPWLNFEAGALGKSVDKSRVCPFLFRLKRSEVEGPILQFQSTIYDKNDMLKLVKSVNACCGESIIEEPRLERAFDVWWPSLREELDAIAPEGPEPEHEEQDTVAGLPGGYFEKVLEEILELTRSNQKLLRSPDEILPPQYLGQLLVDFVRQPERERFDEFEHPVFDDLLLRFRDLVEAARAYKKLTLAPVEKEDLETVQQLLEAVNSLGGPIRYIAGHRRGPRRRPFPLEDLQV